MSNKRITENNRQAILAFEQECRANNLSFARRVKYLYTLPILAERLGTASDSTTAQDVENLVGQINDNKSNADWSKNRLQSSSWLGEMILGGSGVAVGGDVDVPAERQRRRVLVGLIG